MTDFGRNIETITVDRLLPVTTSKKMDGWRLAQVCSAYVAEKYELSYTFTKMYDMITYRIVVEKEEEVPSITQIYKSAFLYENEMKELFGVNMQNIGFDYDNKLYRIKETAPFMDKKEEK